PRTVKQIDLAFGISINKDVVRRILAPHYPPSADGSGPSGSLSSVTRRIASIALISSDVNRWRADVLGTGGDGSVHPPNRWVRRPGWRRRWFGPVSHVQSSDSMAG